MRIIPRHAIGLSSREFGALGRAAVRGHLSRGPEVAAFEAAFAAAGGVAHALGVSSGRSAWYVILKALGLEPGDEVLVPGYTYFVVPEIVSLLGLRPVFLDVSRETYTVLPAEIEKKVTARTRAIVVEHVFGMPCPIEEIEAVAARRNLVLIEDCAQAIGALADEHGRHVGTVGELGAFSFFSKKQLCVGEGGMVATADEEMAARVRLLRSHAMTSTTWDRHRGHDPAYDVVDIGFNYRLDEPRAALGLSRIERLDKDIARRRELVRSYRERLTGIAGLELPFDEPAVERSSHFAFPVLLADRETRDRFRDDLKADGIQTTWYPALHSFTEYRAIAPTDGLPHATEVAGRHCALPLSSTMDEAKLEMVVAAVRAALA